MPKCRKGCDNASIGNRKTRVTVARRSNMHASGLPRPFIAGEMALEKEEAGDFESRR